jgi:protein-S-isoprenylcysteine O-methyltransferase Ste14
MNQLYKRPIRSSVLGTLAVFVFLFIAAGTLYYWQGWAYVVTFVICSGGYTLYLAKHDPALLKRRTEAGISHEKEPTQKVVMVFLFTGCIVLVVLPPLDVRFGWSNMPWYICAFGDAFVVISFYLFYLVSKVNTYAAANIRVKEGQKVISTGMFATLQSRTAISPVA